MRFCAFKWSIFIFFVTLVKWIDIVSGPYDSVFSNLFDISNKLPKYQNLTTLFMLQLTRGWFTSKKHLWGTSEMNVKLSLLGILTQKHFQLIECGLCKVWENVINIDIPRFLWISNIWYVLIKPISCNSSYYSKMLYVVKISKIPANCIVFKSLTMLP